MMTKQPTDIGSYLHTARLMMPYVVKFGILLQFCLLCVTMNLKYHAVLGVFLGQLFYLASTQWASLQRVVSTGGIDTYVLYSMALCVITSFFTVIATNTYLRISQSSIVTAIFSR